MLPELEVKDSIRDPDSYDQTARWRNPATDKPLYRVYLYLEETKLPYVKAVTYVLHPTFTNPPHPVYRTHANPRCTQVIWTSRLFRVQAIVTDRDGNMSTLTHDLQYDKEFSEVPFVAA